MSRDYRESRSSGPVREEAEAGTADKVDQVSLYRRRRRRRRR